MSCEVETKVDRGIRYYFVLLNTACFGVISPSSCKKGDFGNMLNTQILKMLQMGTIQLLWTKMGPRTGEFHEFPPLRRCILFPPQKRLLILHGFCKEPTFEDEFSFSRDEMGYATSWGGIGGYWKISYILPKTNIPNAKTIRR